MSPSPDKKKLVPVQAFTSEYPQLSNVLINDVVIHKAYRPGIDPATEGKDFKALWDTGATHSVINQKVIDSLNLVQIGVTKTYHAHGEEKNVPQFLVNIGLPNRVEIFNVRVTRGVISNADVLIGMDIIGVGDFAVSNHKGQTRFTFRCPSCEAIDFVKKRPQQAQTKKVGRNDPCSCGSGQKYKHCCGSPK